MATRGPLTASDVGPDVAHEDGDVFVVGEGTNTVVVANIAQLQAAINGASPGDKIVLADGNYGGSNISISGIFTQANGLTIEAQNYGSAVWGAAGGARVEGGIGRWLVNNAAHITIRGIFFANTPASSNGRNSVLFQNASFCRLTRCHFDVQNGNGTSYDFDVVTIDNGTDPHHIRIDRNYLTSKTASGVYLYTRMRSNGTTSVRDCWLDYNHVDGFDATGDGNFEPVRLGHSTAKLTNGNHIFENNLLQDLNADDEWISVKVSSVILRYNTFIDCSSRTASGCLDLRTGHNTTVHDNFWFRISGTNCGGITVDEGSGHFIYNNYMHNLDSVQTNRPGGIILEVNQSSVGDLQVTAFVYNNTMIDCARPITVGRTRDASYNQQPINCVVANNLVDTDTSQPIFSKHASATCNTTNNLFFNAGSGGVGVSGQITSNPENISIGNGIFRWFSGAPAHGAANSSFKPADDIFGNLRPSPHSIGCFEAAGVYVDSFGDVIGWNFNEFDHLITPVGTGFVSLNGGAMTTLQAAINSDPTGTFRMEGEFTLVGECTALRSGGRVFGAPTNEGGCIMKGSLSVSTTSGWTNNGTHWSRTFNFPRLPNHGTVGGNLQEGADVAHGMPEQVWVDTGGEFWQHLTPVSGIPNTGQFSIAFNGSNGPHTVRLGTNPASYQGIELSRAFPGGKAYFFAGTSSEGEVFNIDFRFAAAALFRSPIGSFQSFAEDGLVRNMTYRYCTMQYMTGIGVHAGSGWLIDRCKISDIGQTAFKCRMQHDNGQRNGTVGQQSTTRIINSLIQRAPLRRVKVGTEGGLSKSGNTYGLHSVNCWWRNSWGDGWWQDNDQFNNDCRVQSNRMENIAKFGMHIEISNPLTNGIEMLYRWNDIFNCGTGQGVAGSSEDQLNGDGGASVIISSSHWTRLTQNRIMARTQAAIVYAAHGGRQGIVGLRSIGNNIGRMSGFSANRKLIQRTLTGGQFTNVQINQNDHWVPASNTDWNTFQNPGGTTARTFGQWQSQLGFDLSGTASNTGAVPFETNNGWVPFQEKHYGPVAASITGEASESSRSFSLDGILLGEIGKEFSLDALLDSSLEERFRIFRMDAVLKDTAPRLIFRLDALLATNKDTDFRFYGARLGWLFDKATVGRVS